MFVLCACIFCTHIFLLQSPYGFCILSRYQVLGMFYCVFVCICCNIVFWNGRYPVPQRAETQGRSEEYLGRWIRDRKISRDRVVLATKVSTQL
jgi:hypothetical protein